MTSSLWRLGITLAFLGFVCILPASSAAQTPTYLTQWGSLGSDDGQFNIPVGVATDAAGNVYVADAGNSRIQKFSGNGTYLTQWGTEGSGNGQFLGPNGVATDAAGNVYVTDSNNRIQKFTSTGTYLAQWGSGVQFVGPSGVATDAAGNVFVLDRGNHRVQKFTGIGSFLTQWGSLGSGNGQFGDALFGIATGPDGDVYVVDGLNNRVQKFTGTGTYLTQWGSLGDGDGQFVLPMGVATDAAGNVYVADYGNERIQKFTSTGTYLTQWGSIGSGNGELYGPTGLATNASGDIYVTEQYNQRVQKFGLAPVAMVVDVDLAPNVINLASHAPWVTAYLEPSGFDPADIDLSTVRLAGSVPTGSKSTIVADHNRNGIPDLMVKFSRSALDPLLTPGMNELDVTGSLVTGEEFKGSDEVRVIDPPAAPLSASVTPNPFNPSGMLSFNTLKPGHVRVMMFDLHGRLVRTLMEMPHLLAGEHEVRIDGRGERGEVLPSGVYFYRVGSPDGTTTGCFAILK